MSLRSSWFVAIGFRLFPTSESAVADVIALRVVPSQRPNSLEVKAHFNCVVVFFFFFLSISSVIGW